MSQDSLNLTEASQLLSFKSTNDFNIVYINIYSESLKKKRQKICD